MTIIKFSMAGPPRGKGRPRATVRSGHAQIYTDSATRQYEKSVRELTAGAMRGAAPFTGPLSVSLQFRIGLAASMSKRQRARILAGEEPWFGGPDADNLAKAVLDGMNAVAFLDDKQITRLWAVKVPSDSPGVDVRVEALAEPTP